MEERGEKEKQAEAQALILRLQQYQAQMEATTQELALLNQTISEHDKAIETIKQLKKMKVGDELLVSIGAGSLVYVTLSSTDKVIVRLGAGVSAEKDPDSSIEFLKGKKEELEKLQGELTANLQKVQQEAQKIQAKLQEIIAARQNV
ncbi:MAG: prefoldin subunit alpha [Candidatus Methanospirareceae archaeon]